MTPEELHRKKLKEIGYKDLEIERLVLKYMTNCTYEFAEAYHAEQLLIQRVVVPKGTLCECSWPLIRTGTSERAEYCGNCGNDI